MRTKMGLCTVLIAVLGLLPATGRADVMLFNDDFEAETAELNHFNFLNWDVTRGSVDLLSNHFSGFPGKYVDLDGSGYGSAGKMETKTAFALSPGVVYTLKFDLAGDQRGGTNTVTVSLGGFSESFALGSSAPFTTFSRDITVAALTNAKIVFDHAGYDYLGLLLDNVSLSAVPVPGAVWLLGSGLLGLAGWRRMGRKSQP